ncbi:hypothetical protein BJ166DRAFT_338984 [Pestalotiopsis sp. NC0098]|nr:hypothetical protein BJ166DRAFT_338984 [Pestalotiopsis sp. NC0098]
MRELARAAARVFPAHDGSPSRAWPNKSPPSRVVSQENGGHRYTILSWPFCLSSFSSGLATCLPGRRLAVCHGARVGMVLDVEICFFQHYAHALGSNRLTALIWVSCQICRVPIQGGWPGRVSRKEATMHVDRILVGWLPICGSRDIQSCSKYVDLGRQADRQTYRRQMSRQCKYPSAGRWKKQSCMTYLCFRRPVRLPARVKRMRMRTPLHSTRAIHTPYWLHE